MVQCEFGFVVGELFMICGYLFFVFVIIFRLFEWAGSGVGLGSIIVFYMMFLEGDDLGDPIGDVVRVMMDGHVVLFCKLVDCG